jgi:hypothetical protein
MTELLEGTTQFWLEDDRDRHDQRWPDPLKDPVEGIEFEYPTKEIEEDEERDHATDKLQRARTLGHP